MRCGQVLVSVVAKSRATTRIVRAPNTANGRSFTLTFDESCDVWLARALLARTGRRHPSSSSRGTSYLKSGSAPPKCPKRPRSSGSERSEPPALARVGHVLTSQMTQTKNHTEHRLKQCSTQTMQQTCLLCKTAGMSAVAHSRKPTAAGQAWPPNLGPSSPGHE